MGTTGGAVASFGIAHSTDRDGGLFQKIAGGNVLLGSIGGNNLFQVDGMAPSMRMAFAANQTCSDLQRLGLGHPQGIPFFHIPFTDISF